MADIWSKLSFTSGMGSAVNSVAFSSDGAYMVAVQNSSSPYINLYSRNGDVFTSVTTEYPGGTPKGVAFSPDGLHIAVAQWDSPYIIIFKRNGNSLTKLSNPASLPAGDAESVSYNLATGQYLAVAHGTSPYVTVYKRNGDIYTKMANPTNLPPGSASSVSFSPDGNYLSVCGTSGVAVYKNNGTTLTKLSGTFLSYPMGTAFSPDGNYLAMVQNGSPYLAVYKRSGDTFTSLTVPSPTKGSRKVAFAQDGVFMAVALTGSPNIAIYKQDGDTFTKQDNPASLPTASGYNVAFSPDVLHLAIGLSGSPWLEIYRSDNPPYSSAPTITFVSATTTRISDETGKTTCAVTFKPNSDIVAWEARADGIGQGSGLLVGSGGAVTANTETTFDVDYTELTLGDKTYRINIYGQNSSGAWTVYG